MWLNASADLKQYADIIPRYRINYAVTSHTSNWRVRYKCKAWMKMFGLFYRTEGNRFRIEKVGWLNMPTQVVLGIPAYLLVGYGRQTGVGIIYPIVRMPTNPTHPYFGHSMHTSR